MMSVHTIRRQPHTKSPPFKSSRKRNSTQAPAQKPNENTSSVSEDGGCDAGAVEEEEEEEADDEDEMEVFAPSGHVENEEDYQAGLSHGDLAAMAKAAKGMMDGIATTDNSDDDDYNGVDLINDSEEEEPQVEQFEEQNIIESEEENCASPGSLAGVDEWNGIEFDGSLFPADVPFFDDQMIHDSADFMATDIEFTLRARQDSSPSPPPTRRVRFVEDVRRGSTDSSSTTDDDGPTMFQDLFMSQDALDPSFRRMIEDDNDGYSLEDVIGATPSVFGEDEDGSSNGSGSSSGYETDLGETTDEEVLPPTTVARPQSMLRLNSPSSRRTSQASSLNATPTARKRGPLTLSQRRGPSMGSWVADPTKPVAVIDSTGKHMLIYPATRPRTMRTPTRNLTQNGASSMNTSPIASLSTLAVGVSESDNDYSDLSSQELVSPTMGSGLNLMMPGVFHGGPGSEHLRGGQVIGPPEAFYRFKSFNTNGIQLLDDDDDDDADTAGENLLNVQDFIDFGDDSSDDEQPTINQATPNNQATSISPSFARLSTLPFPSFEPLSPARNPPTAQDLLNHLDKGVVSAFRRNQDRHTNLLRRPAPGTSAFASQSSKYRKSLPNTLMNPSKKRKASQPLHKNPYPSFGPAGRRKIANTHKRIKSG